MVHINRKYNKGFSLVELIVVILIMAILSVSLTPQVLKWVDHARKARDLDYMHSLESAVTYALMSATVQAEVNAAVEAGHGTALVLIVDGSGTNDPVDDASDSELLKKTAEILGFGTDTDKFKNHKIGAANGVIRISFTGGQVVGKYTVSGVSVDLTNE